MCPIGDDLCRFVDKEGRDIHKLYGDVLVCEARTGAPQFMELMRRNDNVSKAIEDASYFILHKDDLLSNFRGDLLLESEASFNLELDGVLAWRKRRQACVMNLCLQATENTWNLFRGFDDLTQASSLLAVKCFLALMGCEEHQNVATC